jgi:8-oxo-dGTP pyrophosphatase MutT (NUDIX family)
MADDLHLRHSVRALLVDPDNRVLLARFVLPHITLWATPGGGREPGESLLDTLRRELREEVGLDLPDGDLPHVWHRTVITPLAAPGFDGIVEDYFWLRTDAFEPRGDLTDEQLAAENMGELRWWSAADLVAGVDLGEHYSPRYLPTLFQDLLVSGPPTTPIDLGL